MTAAHEYATRIDAVRAQRKRIAGDAEGDRYAGERARRFRLDPHRALDPNLAVLASYVEPADVLIDAGGGAGRVCLPLALRCHEVINFDPSPSMQEQFEACIVESGIANARLVADSWPPSALVSGDVVLTCNVTYFVRDIVPFVQAMTAAARRRVMITVWSVPPPSQDAALFRLITGEEEEAVPGHRELLAVLWELGILPDVRVLPSPLRAWDERQAGREAAIDWAVDRLPLAKSERGRAAVSASFEQLFAPDADGFRPLWRPAVRELLVTWETAGVGSGQ